MIADCESGKYGNQEYCKTWNPMSYVWMEVPAVYECRDTTVCTQHVNANGEGYVPCYISRPYEKTVFLRYMGTLSGICLLVSILELCVILSRKMWKRRKVAAKNFMEMAPMMPKRSERYSSSAFYPTNNSGPGRYDDRRQLYPSLAVPVRISSREDSSGGKKSRGSLESLASVKTPTKTKE